MSEIKWNLKTYNISELTDYYKNPRQLTDKQFNQLKKSIDKFGMIDKPIINADEKHTVIGGHQRLRGCDPAVGGCYRRKARGSPVMLD
jgi:ParB-like chromosome segregation protein Spo0J